MSPRQITRTCWPIFALAVFSAPAWGQEPVTFADLEGAEVVARIVDQRVVRRDGRHIPARHENDVKLVIGPGDNIHHTIISTSHTPRGTRQSAPRQGSHTLEHPRPVKSSGGGHAVYVFTDGTLTFLRTFKGGAYKRTVAFARGAGGLTCTANQSFAREDGVGNIVFDSAIIRQQVEIVSIKQVSSTCRVAKQSQPPALQ